jgi:hypothetical protein
MKIDRHNYEEFFILYWDNELTALQKQAVENFVTQNTDLHEEFELLGESRFTPEATVQFKEKDFLLNDSFINITNYEEQLLNYIDDEVTTEEKKEVEKFVGLHPAAQKELALLKRTKLLPESVISFTDKSILYRKEEKPVPVLSMTWFRLAVAAAIILIAGFTVLQLVKTGKAGNVAPVASTDPRVTDPSNNQVTIIKDQITKDPEQKIASVNNKSIKDQPQQSANNSITQAENKNNLPKPRRDVFANDQRMITEVAIAYTPVELEKVDRAQKTGPIAINNPLADADVTNKPMPALYIPEQDTKEKDGGGIKEFLRKTTRVFERRTKMQTTTEDNKLLLGAFAVSLK